MHSPSRPGMLQGALGAGEIKIMDQKGVPRHPVPVHLHLPCKEHQGSCYPEVSITYHVLAIRLI